MSYLTEDELQAVQKMHRRAPYSIHSISRGYFSIARMSGGMSFQGCHFVYFHEHDECVREDVVAAVAKMRRKKK